MSCLARPEYRGRWRDTRSISDEVFATAWSTQEQISKVRQALHRLEGKDLVTSTGFTLEWRATQYEAIEEPRFQREALEYLQKQGML